MIAASSPSPAPVGGDAARPLRVVSVSLGSPARDYRLTLRVLGRDVVAERIGVPDLAAYGRMLRALDGQVDVLAIGGANLALTVGHRRYPIRDIARLVRGLRTPVVDGGALKSLLERWLVLEWLPREHGVDLRGRRVLLVSAVDRYGLAEAFTRAGSDVRFGDLMFALGLPVLLRGLGTVRVLATVALPVITRLPFTWLYPTGARQEEIVPRFASAYAWAEVLAGDFLYIRRHMPEDLGGKLVFTNTLTAADVEALRRRGVWMVVTSTPELGGGRSPGTNVVQAILVAVSGRRPEELAPQDYLTLMAQAGFRPRVEVLNPERAWAPQPGTAPVRGPHPAAGAPS